MPQALDRSFGIRGRVTTQIGDPSEHSTSTALALAFLEGGKIAAAGMTAPGSFLKTDFALIHYQADGRLDKSFGNGGQVTSTFGGEHDQIRAIVFQNDGKIVVAGCSPGEGNLVTVRYQSDGNPDPGFGANGTAVTHFDDAAVNAEALAIQNDGKVVVAGSIGFPETHALLVRYNADGSIDTTFGEAGIVRSAFGGSINSPNALAIQDDGKIVAGGSFGLVRYNSDGSPDTGFGSEGMAINFLHAAPTALAIQKDGRIVAAGADIFPGFLLARFESGGRRDTTFGIRGKVKTKLGKYSSNINALAVQPDGKIVAVGSQVIFADRPMPPVGQHVEITDFAVARYRRNGKPDNRFGMHGHSLTDFHKVNDVARTVAIQPDGKLVVAGYM